MPRFNRAIGALTLAAVLPLLAGPAATATTPRRNASVKLSCRAKTPVGTRDFQSVSSTTIRATAPATVRRGGTLTVQLAAQPSPVPTEVAGYHLNHLRALQLRFRVDAGSDIAGVRLAGGSAPGASVSAVGRLVTVSAPAVVPGGGTLALPGVLVDLRATGAAGSRVALHVAGTSFTDWTVQFIAQVHYFGDHDLPTSCYGVPVNVQLASVPITA
jgi:hypothetical protein